MAEPVAFISRFRIRPGQRNAYEQLAAEVTPQLKIEKPHTLVFLSYLGDDDSLSIIHIFPDAEAMDRHLVGSEQRGAAVMRLLVPLGWELYGSVSQAALASMTQRAATVGAPLTVHGEFLAGFLRQQSGE